MSFDFRACDFPLSRACVAAERLGNLEGLTLSFNDDITDDSLDLLAMEGVCPRLTRLDISGCRVTDNGVRALAKPQACPSLLSLCLDQCEVTDAGVRALATKGACPLLERLTLADCGGLTDGAVALIASTAEAFPKLVILDLMGCHELTDRAMWAFAARGALPSLERLSVARCRGGLTGVGVRGLGAARPNVKIQSPYAPDSFVFVWCGPRHPGRDK